MASLFDFEAERIDGTVQALADYKGKVVLVVNTASHCGFTPQFEGLEELYERYHGEGLEILGFPCNQFASQDKGSNGEIAEFCTKNYGVTFPMFAKVDVNGSKAHPVFNFLRKAKRGVVGDRIKWNFTKFLVGTDGTPVARFGSATTPEKIAPQIEAMLRDRSDTA